MSYNPISGFTLQVITQTGQVGSDYYLKFYEANTTTPLSMATDSAGGTLLSKAKINDSGFPISNPLDNSTVFIPHVNTSYRLVVYMNEADADANDTASAYVNIPFVSTLLGASSVGTAAYLDTGTEPDDVPTNAQLAPYLGRNLIINGDFSVWQRGTSQTSDGYGSADRWSMNASGATFTSDQQTHALGQTDVPSNPKYFLRHDVTTGNNFTGTEHDIESVISTAGREVTLSFYAKGVNPGGGEAGVRITQRFGTGGSPSASVVTDLSNFVLTSSWQRFTYTFTPASVSGKTLGTDGNDTLRILIGQGSDTSTDAWNIDVSNVQLEFGDVATDFEYVSPADQEARCKRYFERIKVEDAFCSIAAGYSESASQARAALQYEVRKRAIPTVTFSSNSHFATLQTGSDITSTNMTANDTTQSFTRIHNNTAGHTAGQGILIAINNTAGYVDVDAEF